jgi:hypothetical protein
LNHPSFLVTRWGLVRRAAGITTQLSCRTDSHDKRSACAPRDPLFPSLHISRMFRVSAMAMIASARVMQVVRVYVQDVRVHRCIGASRRE